MIDQNDAVDSSGATPLSDLDAYVALPRLSGLILSHDGSRLVTSVSSLDPEGTSYVSALWEVDPAGEQPARRLTRSAKGEAEAAFAPDGDLLFVSSRPDPDEKADDTEDDQPALWVLPARGGEARVVATAPGGIGGVLAAREDATVSVSAPVLRGADGLATDEQRRKERKEKKVSAILHTGYPVRHWDHDLGPEEDRRYVATLDGLADGDRGALVQLTGAGRHFSPEHEADLTPDGSRLIATWRTPDPDVGWRETLVAIDTATGERETLLDEPEVGFLAPQVSPDGRWVSYMRQQMSTAETAPVATVGLLALDGSAGPRILAAEWDRWPTGIAWLPDSGGLLITADEDGRGPVFLLTLEDAATVHRVTADDAVFTDVVAAPDGSTAYALRSSYAAPPEPVRIDLAAFRATGEPVFATLLQGPVPTPRLPGTLTEVETTADTLTEVETTAEDGTRVRAWLALPENASPSDPAPLLLWIHGGPMTSWNAWSWRWNPWLLASQGYAVLLPDPALSTGYGQEFIQRGWGSWGDKPFTDLMAITDACVARPDIDEGRTAAMGGSFGGYMANWVAGHTGRFDAIVTHAGLWALDNFGSTTDHGYFWKREMTPEMAQANSPHQFVERIATPMLVIHGDKDYRVPINDALRLWQELLTDSALPADADGNTVHRFLYFPDENHWVLTPQHAKVWYQVVSAFLAEHVLGKPVELPTTLG